jgi:hypothetical protein
MTPADIGELKAGQKAIMRELVDFRAETRLDLKDHEKRIRSNEKWKWSLGGISSVFAAIFAALFGGMFR